MITKENILRHELLGLPVEVVQAANPAQQGMAGTIVDETRNMLVIMTPRGRKSIGKAHATFRLTLPSGMVVDVSGSALVSRPEKRIARAAKTKVEDESQRQRSMTEKRI
jgi:ribonuclease P protein subunit POP4